MITGQQEFVLVAPADPRPLDLQPWVRPERALVVGELVDEPPLPGSRLRLIRRGRPPETLPGWSVFDGAATGEGADGALAPLRSLAGSRRASGAVAAHLQGVVGCFAGLVRVAPDRLIAATDPFGAGLLVTCALPGVSLVSNTVWLLEDVARALGHRLTRHVTAVATEALLRSSPFGATGFAEVARVPIGAVVEATDANGIRIVEDSDPGRRFRPAMSFHEHIAAAAAEITTSVREARSSVPEHQPAVCDLSGGRDSRLVAAAVFAAGMQDRFAFTCWGDHPSPDYNTFAYLRDALELEEAPRPSVRATYSLARSPSEALRTFMFRSMGLISDFHALGEPRASAETHGLLLAGGFAFHKGYGASTEAPPSLVAAVDDVLARAPWGMTERFVAAELAGQVRRRMLRAFERSSSHGATLQAAQSRWHVESRFRDHYGLIWQMQLRERTLLLHPLYSPNANLAAHALGDTERTQGRATFELFRQLYEPLATFPFAKNTWHPDLYAGDPSLAVLRLQRPITTRSPRLAVRAHHPPMSPRPDNEGSTAVSAWQQRHRERGRPAWHVYFDVVLPELDRLISDAGPTSMVWEVFDHNATRKLIDRGIESRWSGPTMLLCYRLFAAIVWAHELETPPSRT